MANKVQLWIYSSCVLPMHKPLFIEYYFMNQKQIRFLYNEEKNGIPIYTAFLHVILQNQLININCYSENYSEIIALTSVGERVVHGTLWHAFSFKIS